MHRLVLKVSFYALFLFSCEQALPNSTAAVGSAVAAIPEWVLNTPLTEVISHSWGLDSLHGCKDMRDGEVLPVLASGESAQQLKYILECLDYLANNFDPAKSPKPVDFKYRSYADEPHRCPPVQDEQNPRFGWVWLGDGQHRVLGYLIQQTRLGLVPRVRDFNPKIVVGVGGLGLGLETRSTFGALLSEYQAAKQ